MTSDPRTRAGDEDRERTATALGGHYAAGRLTLEEFQQRLDQAYAAKTLGELDELMTDLPGPWWLAPRSRPATPRLIQGSSGTLLALNTPRRYLDGDRKGDRL
jgi:Domain of unknown function (DUF1707)